MTKQGALSKSVFARIKEQIYEERGGGRQGYLCPESSYPFTPFLAKTIFKDSELAGKIKNGGDLCATKTGPVRCVSSTGATRIVSWPRSIGGRHRQLRCQGPIPVLAGKPGPGSGPSPPPPRPARAGKIKWKTIHQNRLPPH